MLDQSGKLVAHNNIDDDAVFQKWEEQEKATEERGPAGMGPTNKHGCPGGPVPNLDNIPSPKNSGRRPRGS